MSRTEIPIVVLDPEGRGVSGASVSINYRGGAAAPVYAAETGNTTKTQPITTDSAGRVDGWVGAGRYEAQINAPGYPVRVESFDSAPAVFLLPTGTILPFLAVAVPVGFLLCDGSELLATEVDLIALLSGNPYGVGANNRPRLPDLRGRTPIGQGQGTGLTQRVLGQSGGVETHKLLSSESGVPAHVHGVTDPGHGHSVLFGVYGGAAGSYRRFEGGENYSGVADPRYYDGTSDGSGRTYVQSRVTGISVNNNTVADAGNAHPNMQPYTVVNYMVKT